MLPTKESLTVEFKSGRQRPQTDDEIVDNVVAMAKYAVPWCRRRWHGDWGL